MGFFICFRIRKPYTLMSNNRKMMSPTFVCLLKIKIWGLLLLFDRAKVCPILDHLWKVQVCICFFGEWCINGWFHFFELTFRYLCIRKHTRSAMANTVQSQNVVAENLRKQLAVAVRSIRWSYAIFWSLSTTQLGYIFS